MDKGPLDAYTLPARIVIVAGILSAFGGTWAYVTWVYDDLPAGRYPLFVFAVPVMIAAAVFVGIGLGMLRFFGVPIMHPRHCLTDADADGPTDDRTNS
jgi:hypothetical protein